MEPAKENRQITEQQYLQSMRQKMNRKQWRSWFKKYQKQRPQLLAKARREARVKKEAETKEL